MAKSRNGGAVRSDGSGSLCGEYSRTSEGPGDGNGAIRMAGSDLYVPS